MVFQKRVMLVLESHPDYTIQLANALNKKCDLTLLVYENSTTKKKLEKIDFGIKKKIIKKPKNKSIKNILWVLKLAKIIKREKIEIIHFQYGSPWLLFLKPLIKTLIITTIHDINQHPGEERLYSSLVSKTMRHISNGFFVHGENLKKLFIKKWGSKKPLAVIPHGRMQILRNTKKYKEKHNSILFFGRISKYKGLKYLVETEKYLKQKYKNFEIIIAGKGKIEEPVFEKIKKSKHIILINRFLSETDLNKLFSETSIVVLPYIEASQSGVVPVAYEFKKPVIATDVGSLKEAVVDGTTGLIVPPKNSKELFKAIDKLLSNKKLMKKLGEEGFNFAVKELSWNTIATKTASFYEEVEKL